MRRSILISTTLLVLFCCLCEAQLIKGLGFKAGLAAETQKWDFPTWSGIAFNTKIHPGLDVGIFLEWLDVPYISVLTELHYIQKGAECRSNVMLTTPSRPDGIGYSFTPRLDYLSIPLLMKFRFNLPILYVYLLAGPRIDIFLSKRGDEWPLFNEVYQKENLSGTFGIGFGSLSLKPFTIGIEFRYSPDFQKSYSTNDLKVYNQSLEFLLVISY